MSRKLQDVANAELSVLQVLWELKTATVRELTERIYQNCTAALNATVQKLLERLEAKKYVKRNRKTWPHQFTACVEREALIGQQLQTLTDQLCQGEIQPLLSCLVKTYGLTDADRQSLRGLLDELDGGDTK
ncbi:MAG: BlaI/MecI/CopY family transcriptional regulator [Planctomycetes bacterium]|nr:BlaI/MecI/CopY family transcriptional regulator [Planctomycetota bacterium]